MSMPDCPFEYLPLACLRWDAPSTSQPQPAPVPNLAFGHTHLLTALPDIYSWADGKYTLRLPAHSGERPLCRIHLCTLPGGTRLGVFEDVQVYHQDALTGLEDRRALWLDAAQMEGTSLALLDIDGFKAINDTLGHAAGDVVLRALADLLRASAQAWGARVYRLGGDEFVIMGVEPQQAPLSAEQLIPVQSRFRRLVAQGGMEVSGFSYGLAHAPYDGQNLCELLEQADARLTLQKAHRRGAMAAQLVRHLKRHAADDLCAADQVPRLEMRAPSLHWSALLPPRPPYAENV